ncbi:MAG: thermopsin family protease [Nitrososphaerales archaeon]
MPAYSEQSSNVVVSLGYFEFVPLVASSNATYVSYSASSNTSISTAFMTVSQFLSFNSTGGDISNALYDQNGTSSSHSLMVGEGTYYFVFYAYSANSNVTYSYSISPNNPFQNGPLISPQPTGIASFGLYNIFGNVAPYAIKTNEVVGTANISSILAYNATAASVNDSLSGATLQLNSMLVVTDMSGAQKIYWAQNTPDFVTNNSVIAYGDNVWNNTDSSYSLNNATIVSQSGGYVLLSNNSGQIEDYYAYAASNSSYGYPFDIALIMNESVDSAGVVLQMGVSVLRNGSFSASPIDWFDNITINDASVQNAYFYTSGNDSTPLNTFYDSELVFGGEGNGEATHFNEMNASLGLYYSNESSGVLTAFPSYYSFGGDTAEAADNLHVSYSGNGIVKVTTGTPDYVYLGNASNAVLTNLETTATLSSVTSSGAVSSTSSSSTAFSNFGGLSRPSINGELIGAGLALVIIVAAVVYLGIRRGRTRSIQLE